MSESNWNSRLHQIEKKLDNITEIMIAMARTEEKIVNLENDKTFLMETIIKIDERLDTAEKRLDESEVTIRVINRLFWITATALAGGLVGLYIL